ncbi:hypothetical protein SAMN05421828_14318 [Acidiphilium rubrum]|uniref:Uncharacterized protein n=1 Tax=Acidiphilium rubrum TaxID=526 RepID=A0A8G2CNW1_ACIRU|nr:hypothetical protein SAMN05421828_14318 [Acidiphilium rubrum]
MLIHVATSAFASGEGGQCIKRATKIRIGLQPNSAGTSNPAPATRQDNGAEQIRLDFNLIVAAFIQRWSEPGQGYALGKQEQLHRGRPRVPHTTPS